MSKAAPLASEVGSLFLLKLRDRSQPSDLPPVLSEFEYAKFSDDTPGPLIVLPQEMGGTPQQKKLRFLGLLECM